MKRKALIVIDFQNDFVFNLLNCREVINPVLHKIRENAENDIYYTVDLHPQEYCGTVETEKFPKHCLANTDGSAIVPCIRYALDRAEAEMVVKSTFCHTRWQQHLCHHYDEIEVVGVATDICVLNNALILRSLYPSCRIVVDSSCCAGTSKENHEMALALMRTNCIEVL